MQLLSQLLALGPPVDKGRVVRYLKGHPGQGILLQAGSPLILTAYCDYHEAICRVTQQYASGYFVSLGGSLISWKTKKQHMVSHSSVEGEYLSMVVTLCELKWLRQLLQDLRVFIHRPILLHFIVIIK